MVKIMNEKLKDFENYKSIVVIDIETTGLDPTGEDKITCICAKDIYSTERFEFVSYHEKDMVDRFIKWMVSTFDCKQTLLVTCNGKSFDLPFIKISALINNVKDWNILNIYPHFDVGVDITDKRISLNNLAKLYNCEQKTANGLRAIKWFEQGKLNLIKEYCKKDVEITASVFSAYVISFKD
jgi:uncharacterized protein YprB with RNaseH-like and TPR domain